MSGIGFPSASNFAYTTIATATDVIATGTTSGAGVVAGSQGPTLDLNFQFSPAGEPVLDPRITFSRGTNATYTDSTGTIQYAQANALTYSEQFDNAAWTKGLGVTVTADTTVAPDGATTGDTVTADSGLGVYQTIVSVIGIAYTQSMYIKAGGGNPATSLLFRDDTGAGRNITVDPATGVVTSPSGTLISYGSTSVGNGWYRIYMSYLADTTGVRGFIRPSSAGLAQTFFVWGAQTNVGALQSYIATTTTAYYGPRFDYDPITLVCKGLLIEEARTNLVRNSTATGAVAGSPGTPPTFWGIVSDATHVSSVIGTGTETGIAYADIQYVLSPGAVASTMFYADTPAGTALSTYTGSYYLKLVSGAIPQVRFIFQDGATTVNGSLFSITSTFTRYTSTNTVVALGTLARFAIGVDATAGGATFVIRVGLPQTELGAFATSVIPTATATATRNRDNATMTGTNFSSWYNQTAGTIALNIQWEGLKLASSQTILQIDDGTTANRIVFAASSSNSLLNVVTSAGVPTNVLTPATTYVAATSYKHAFAVSDLDFQLAINGTLGTQVTTGAMPISVNALRFGTNITTFANIWFQSLAYYPTRLPNATLQAITR